MRCGKFLYLVLLVALIVGCDNKDDNPIIGKSQIEIKSQIKTPKGAMKQMSANQSKVVFTGDEIVSYNGTTGEIIFKNINSDEPVSETLSKILENFSDKLEFYKNGKFLFKLKSKVVTDMENPMYHTPVLHYNTVDFTTTDKGKFYIVDGYPWGLPISRYKESKNDERIENVEKILDGWNVFVETLKEEGKYIE